MIRIRFIGDGPRDQAVLPPIVDSFLSTPIRADFEAWPRLHTGGGYRGKIKLATRQAKDAGQQAIVAVADRDVRRGDYRIKELRKGREEHREKHVAVPTALGLADPHLEAWLIDDPLAVRTALRLPPNAQIPNVRKCDDPKKRLNELWEGSARRSDAPEETAIQALSDVAMALAIERCPHSSETGLAEFADDVRREIGPLIQQKTIANPSE
ncbi:hypothetical protein RAS1_00520 [Phycisphaerae bacterium RAS1]|nr:hypothetical protein RAS1_00520 [Phycisphaerae bacterium RAS1]